MQALEGKFEPIAEKLNRVQTKLQQAAKGGMFEDLLELLAKFDLCERLISSSVFADLEDGDGSLISQEEIESELADLKAELNAAFAQDQRIMVRSRMSAVLSQLPIFFDSRTEVMNYVRESLDGCRDNFEKMISIRIILDSINGRNEV